MTKRKSRKPIKAGAKKLPPLQTVFDCPFCNECKSIRIKMNRKEEVGSLACSICEATFSCKIQDLSVAVDVYSAFIDECWEANKEEEEEEVPVSSMRRKRNAPISVSENISVREIDDGTIRESVERRRKTTRRFLSTTGTDGEDDNETEHLKNDDVSGMLFDDDRHDARSDYSLDDTSNFVKGEDRSALWEDENNRKLLRIRGGLARTIPTEMGN